MRGVAHGWIHLRARAEALIATGRFECEMMRGRLDRSHMLVAGETTAVPSRRNVQPVHARACLMRDRDKPLGCLEGCNFIAPPRMRTWIALDAQILALVQARFVFGVKRGA